jgi:hypothetical protein
MSASARSIAYGQHYTISPSASTACHAASTATRWLSSIPWHAGGVLCLAPQYCCLPLIILPAHITTSAMQLCNSWLTRSGQQLLKLC